MGLKKFYKKYIERPLKKALNFVGNLIGLDLSPDIPDYSNRNEPSDLGAPRVGGGVYIPQYLTYRQNPAQISGGYLIYRGAGATRTGGILVHSSTDGTNNKFLHLTYVLTSNNVVRVSAIDNAANFPSLTGNPVHRIQMTNKQEVTTRGPYSGAYYERAYFNDGYTDPVHKPSWHSDANYYPGLATVRIRLEAPDPNANLKPPPFTGVPEYQWYIYFGADQPWITNLESSYADTNFCSYGNLLYKYLTDPINGAGISSSLIDADSFVDADEYFYCLFAKPGVRLKDQTIVQNIKDILFTAQAYIVFRNGKFVFKPDPNYMWYVMNVADTKDRIVRYFGLGRIPSLFTFGSIQSQLAPTTHTVTEEDIVDGVQLEPVVADQKYTDVQIEYINQDLNQRTSFVDEDIKTRFNVNRKNKENILKTQINSIGAPAHLHNYLFTQSQYADVISFSLLPKFLDMEPGDLINITFDAAQLNGDLYVIQSLDVATDYSINVKAKKYLGSVTRTNDLQRLLAATRNTQSAYNEENTEKVLLEAQASNDIANNTQITTLLSSPFNGEPFTDFQILRRGNPYITDSGFQAQSLSIELNNFEPNGSDIEYQIKRKGNSGFDVISSTFETIRTSTTIRTFAKLQFGFYTGQTYEITVSAKDPITGAFLDSKTKTYTVPGASVYIGSGSTRTIEEQFTVSENAPFGYVVQFGTDGVLTDDPNLTWDELDDSTGGGIHPTDLLVGRYTWSYFASFDIPWSHIPVFNFGYGYVAAIGEASYLSQTIDLGADTDFWWTADAQVSPNLNDPILQDNFYGNEMFGAFPAYEFDVLRDDSSLVTITQTADNSFSPGSTATPVATYQRGRYITPTIYSIAKGGSGVQVLGINQYKINIHTNQYVTTLRNVDTSLLSIDTINSYLLDISTISPSTRFGKILSVNIQSSTSEPVNYIGQLAYEPVDNTNTISFDIIRVSDGAVSQFDVLVDITITGFPEVKAILDDEGYPTAMVDNFTGEF